MSVEIIPLFYGFPAKVNRGFLGWGSCYLIKRTTKVQIEHYLFDTGGFNERIELFNRLKDNGIEPKDINGVILSHLHFDHAASWMYFQNATIFVGENELNFVLEEGDIATLNFYGNALKNHHKLVKLKEGDQVAGMTVYDTPGHTKGCISLLYGKEMLVADAIKNRKEITEGPLLYSNDNEISLKSIKKIVSLAEKIYPGHDVPLEKRGDQWIPTDTYEEVITFNQDVECECNKTSIKLKI